MVGTEGADSFDVSIYEGEVIFGGAPLVAGDGCTANERGSEAKCPVPAGGIDISTLGGDDVIHGKLFEAPTGFMTIHFGAGNDKLETYGADTAYGEDGDDEL